VFFTDRNLPYLPNCSAYRLRRACSVKSASLRARAEPRHVRENEKPKGTLIAP
jgi:hypothetical protein